jgi:flagellar biosynthesis protein FlhB
MSDASEKPFEATPRRIARAKREGNVARAGELAANCSFAAAAFALSASAGTFAAISAATIERSMRAAAPAQCARILATALVAIACASVAGTIANLFQHGGLALVPIAVKLERLDPINGLRRILSRETLDHSLRAACAFGCAVAAMIPILSASAAAMTGSATAQESVARAWSDAQRVAFAACAVGLLFSVAEFGAARTVWLRKLRMSLEDRKRESKEEEGDAGTRGRRRTLHRALLRGGLRRVKEAAFVVVNPSHVAIALAYRPPRVAVPEVLVRAADAAALRVREIARSHGIPLVENAALARALYRDARDGEAIPHAFYVAVAEVVAALMRDGELAS